MRIYQSTSAREGEVWNVSAWINRITLYASDGYVAEAWVVWLPSYGMLPCPYLDRAVWSQRGFRVDLRTGRWCTISRQVEPPSA